MSGTAEQRQFLVVRAHAWRCALPVEDVRETMRPLPVTPVVGLPPFVRGLSVVRGEPTPVISLALLLGGLHGGEGRRFISLRIPGRQLVLEVDEVHGLRHLSAGELGAVPSLLKGAAGGQLEVLGTLDGQLLGALSAARLLPEELWAQLATMGGKA